MTELKHTLKQYNLKISDFFYFIEEEKRPSYFAQIDSNGEPTFYESDLTDFINMGDIYGCSQMEN